MDYIYITYDFIEARTVKAILFDFGDEERWIPISVMDPDSFPLKDFKDEVGVEAWFVKKEGLECYES